MLALRQRLARHPQWLVGVAAAIPSIAWALAGADYLTDDFPVAESIARLGLLEGARSLSFVAPARPLVGPYFVLIFEVIGERAVLHALLLAALNAALAVLLWRALRLVVSGRTAFLAALTFAIVPNRGSTRLWFVVGANVMALGLVALGAALLVGRNRAAFAVVLFVAGILLYEGVAGVGGVVVVWWWLQDRSGRTRAAAGALAFVAFATVATWVVSPKRDGGSPGPFANVRSVGPAQLGSGFWGQDVLGALATLVVLVAVGWCIATRLPSFRRPGAAVPREVLMGAGLLMAGAVPFMVGGAPFAVRGIFDRNNLVPDVGSCLIVGALLAAATRRWRLVGWGGALLLLVVLAAGNVADVGDYRTAVRQGHALVQAVVADVDPTAGDVIVKPPFTDDIGVAQFILNSDLTTALVLRHGPEWRSVAMPYSASICEVLVERAVTAERPAFVYDRLDRSLRRATGTADCTDR